jgi:molybdopterin converting factor small subunit
MPVTLTVPTVLRSLTAGAKNVDVEGETVGQVLDALESAHPGFRSRLLDDDGNLNRYVNIFVDDDDVRYMEGLDTKVADGANITIMQAVAGG